MNNNCGGFVLSCCCIFWSYWWPKYSEFVPTFFLMKNGQVSSLSLTITSCKSVIFYFVYKILGGSLFNFEEW